MNKSKKTSTFLNTLITLKQKGNADTLTWGLISISFITILLLFNFRVGILSEAIYTIDDSVTASILGATLPDIRFGHTVIQELKTEYDKTSYDSLEKTILVSEINSKYIVGNNYNVGGMSDMSLLTTSENFESTITNNKKIDNIKLTDYRKLNSGDNIFKNFINNMSILLNTNIANNTIDEVSLGSSIDNIFTYSNVGSKLEVKDATLDKTFYDGLLSKNIKITKLEAYNTFKYTFAKRHIYASPYMLYTTTSGRKINGTDEKIVNGTYGQIIKHLNSNESDIEISWRSDVPQYDGSVSWKYGDSTMSTNELEFSKYLNTVYAGLLTPTSIPIDINIDNLDNGDFSQYYIYRYLWQVDSNAFKNKQLVFYENTGTTYQGQWDSKQNKYNPDNYADYTVNTPAYSFLWCNDNTKAIKISEGLLTDNNDRKVLPIEVYNKYTFDSSSNKCEAQYCSGTPEVNKYKNVKGVESYSATKIYGTSVYVEYEYEVNTFPIGGNVFRLEKFGTQKIKSCKLVSIE